MTFPCTSIWHWLAAYGCHIWNDLFEFILQFVRFQFQKVGSLRDMLDDWIGHIGCPAVKCWKIFCYRSTLDISQSLVSKLSEKSVACNMDRRNCHIKDSKVNGSIPRRWIYIVLYYIRSEMLATRNFGDWHTVVGEVLWSSVSKTAMDCDSWEVTVERRWLCWIGHMQCNENSQRSKNGHFTGGI